MYKCTECKADWETNYCPTCARTIDRAAIEAEREGRRGEAAQRPKPIATRLNRERSSPGVSVSNLRQQIADAKGKLTGKLLLGIGMAAAGLVVTITSYESARSAGGGRHIVTYGLVAAGILTTINALIGFAKIGKIERTIGRQESEQPR